MNILILCTGNSCRSQIAEGFIRHYLKDSSKHFIASAGLEAHGLNPKAVAVMKEVEIEISGHTSDLLDRYLNDKFEYVITVCDNAAENCPVFPGKAERLHWPFDDPAKATGTEEEVLDSFRKIRDQIGQKAKSWVNSIKI